MKDIPRNVLQITYEQHGEIAEALAKKLAAHAWLEGWIAALTYLKGTDRHHAPVNPYIEE